MADRSKTVCSPLMGSRPCKPNMCCQKYTLRLFWILAELLTASSDIPFPWNTCFLAQHCSRLYGLVFGISLEWIFGLSTVLTSRYISGFLWLKLCDKQLLYSALAKAFAECYALVQKWEAGIILANYGQLLPGVAIVLGLWWTWCRKVWVIRLNSSMNFLQINEPL